MDLCIEFQEAYKRLDILCRGCFQANDGVTEYIRQMEYVWDSGEANIPSWTRDYKTLKHLRHIRNKLSHEVGTLSSGICTENDYNSVVNFYDKMMEMKDPLTVYYTEFSPRTVEKTSPVKPKAEAREEKKAKKTGS